MSAYAGTSQLYGQARLEIERLVLAAGGIAVRPGLLYGPKSGGMARTLHRISRLPLVPIPTGGASQFPVHEEDLADAIFEIIVAPGWTPEVIGIAQPSELGLREILSVLADEDGRSCRCVAVPWRSIYWALRVAEASGAVLPLRSDSLLGLVRPAPFVPQSKAFPHMIDRLRVMGRARQASAETGTNQTPAPDQTAEGWHQGALPTVSVVIPAYTMDRWQLTRKAVESARGQTAPVDAVVLCIDNNPELLAVALQEWKEVTGTPVRVVANRDKGDAAGLEMHKKAYGEARRYGAGSARNTAVDTVNSEVVAFMDDDAWAEQDWIERLLLLYRDPTVVAVGGAALPDFQTERPSWFPVNFDWVFGCSYEGLPSVAAPLRHLIGANMSVRRVALAAVGGFHGDDFDDLNVCMRLAAQYGHDHVYYEPDAIVHHYVPARRVSWRYFWRRCYFVNRAKVGAFRRMGSAANLTAERDFVLRSLRKRTVSDIRQGLTGDTAAFGRLGAMLAGIALAAAGHARGQIGHLAKRTSD
jgi:GT2 family glycosyltransferase